MVIWRKHWRLQEMSAGNLQMSAGTWGDHVTLQAAADYFQLRISLVTSFESSAFLEILPQPMGLGNPSPTTCRTLWLSFWAEVHYNSV